MNLAELNKRVQKPEYKTKGNWMVRTFLREWALPCTWVCVSLGVSANQVTVAAIASALFGVFLISLPDVASSLWGVFFVQLWYYLDHVDGQVARYHGASSLTGRFFDFVMHHFVHGLLYFCLILFLFTKTQNVFYVYAAGLSAVSIVVFNLLYDIEYKVFFEKMSGSPGAAWRFRDRIDQGRSQAKVSFLRLFLKKGFSLVHKLNEVHVVMNLLTLLVLMQFFGFHILRTALVWFYILTPPGLMIAKLFYLVSKKQIDLNYELAFMSQEPK